MKRCFVKSPVGYWVIERDEEGICRIDRRPWYAEAAENRAEKDSLLEKAAKELKEYFQGKRREFDLPLSVKGTAFQMKVWRALQEIPYGETRSYGEIAEAIGKPKAARAVGMANNRNPVSIIIPCHRVIGADGKLVGYGGGLDAKEYLLELEAGCK